MKMMFLKFVVIVILFGCSNNQEEESNNKSISSISLSAENDTLKVSIYPEHTTYVRVSDYPLFNKGDSMYYKGKLYNGIYGEYYPCTENPGKLRRHGIIKDGKPEGIFKGYYENGQLCIEEQYSNGALISTPICMDSKGNEIECNELLFIKPLVKEQYWNEMSYGYY